MGVNGLDLRGRVKVACRGRKVGRVTKSLHNTNANTNRLFDTRTPMARPLPVAPMGFGAPVFAN